MKVLFHQHRESINPVRQILANANAPGKPMAICAYQISPLLWPERCCYRFRPVNLRTSSF